MDYRSFYEFEVGVQKIRISGVQGIGLCPVHNDSKPSFSFNIETGQNYCHSCGWKGNAYTLAKELNMDNPRQYIDSSTIDSNNYTSIEYKPINTIKSHSEGIDEVGIMEKYEELKERYGNRINLGDNYRNKYAGKDDNGEAVFIYPNGIKIHKKYWIKEASTDTSNQIFMVDEMSGFDRSKPLYIFEGEKDALISPLQGISFSCGATSIPKDINALYEFKEIIIIYDNDEAGEQGAKKVAERIKSESPITKVLIAQWDLSLPKGYDVYDDGKETRFAKVKEAITNAKEYETGPLVQANTSEEQKGYNMVSPLELIEKNPQPPEPIVDLLLQEKGVTIISGTDGVGKTWFGLQLAVCIASGRDIIDLRVSQRPVLMVQFELSNAQLSSRLQKYDLTGTDGNLHLSDLSDKDLIFTDAWNKIAHTLYEREFKDGVVIVDNVYTSTDKDVSKNHELKPLLRRLEDMKNNTNNAFVLIAHHNKHDGDTEPLLTKSIITGGKTLTNFAHNVLQIGNSSMGADIRRGKITKMRDTYSELYNEPIRLNFNPDTCLFEFGGVIANERLHCEPIKKKWEYKVLVDFAERNADEPVFERRKIQLYLESEFPDMLESTITKKTTRWLNKMTEFALIQKLKHGDYKFNMSAIRDLKFDE